MNNTQPENQKPTLQQVLFPWMHQQYWGNTWSLLPLTWAGTTWLILSILLTTTGFTTATTLIPLAATVIGIGLIPLALRLLDYDKWFMPTFNWFAVTSQDVTKALATGVGLGVFAQAVSFVATNVVHLDTSSNTNNSLSGLEIPTLFIATVFLVPLIEEVIYRGVVMDTLQRFGATALVSILIQGAVFAAGHFVETPMTMFAGVQFFILLVIGLTLGWLRTKTNSIGSTYIAHAVYNIITLVFLLGFIRF